MPWLAEETDSVLVRSFCPGRAKLEIRLDCVKLHTVSPLHKDSGSQSSPPTPPLAILLISFTFSCVLPPEAHREDNWSSLD